MLTSNLIIKRNPLISFRQQQHLKLKNFQNQNNYKLIKLIHIENSVGNTLPFKFRGPETSKVAIATKMIIFFTVGFFTPFAIARYQMKKSGAWP